MAVGNVRVRGAAVGHRSVGEVAIVDQATAVLQGVHDLSRQNGLRDLFQHGGDRLCFFLGQCRQTTTDTAVVGPGWMPPGGRHSLILINRMGRATQVLEVLQPGQYGDEELQDLGLRAVSDAFLMQGHGFDCLHQANALGKLAPDDEHSALGQAIDHAVAHSRPPAKDATSVSEQGSAVKVQVFAV